MDIKAIIVNAAQAIIDGVGEAKKNLASKAQIELPSRFEVEYGINANYIPADYNDVHIAKVRFSVPLLQPSEDKSPATDALQQGEKEKPQQKGKLNKKDTKK